jgi:hypothetical protein
MDSLILPAAEIFKKDSERIFGNDKPYSRRISWGPLAGEAVGLA